MHKQPVYQSSVKSEAYVNGVSEGLFHRGLCLPSGPMVSDADLERIISHEGATLREYPISLTSFLGKTMAYSGGGFFRLLPYWLVSKTMKQRDYNICYFHLNDLIHHRFEFKSRAEYEKNFMEPGTLKNRIVRYVKMNLGKGDAYGKLQRLLSEHEFVNIQEADKMIEWDKVNTIT